MTATARFGTVILLLFAAGCGAHRMSTPATTLSDGDRAALAVAIDLQATRARSAWYARDAKRLLADSLSGPIVETPQGEMRDAERLRADLQRRMDMTVRIDTVTAHLDSVRVIGRDSVLAYSLQRFVRVIRIEEGVERQRFSTVTHEQLFVRRAGRWTPSGPLREIDPRGWWAGEHPPVR